ncbi:hypothetical protein [Chromobacterium haemolyticum]|uniref:hypothetical protein n=1 Tax=Chromobacterium haemolyticum TaxID=394935 RepID=UPI0024487C4E|nr:hypothetical protein [Chromobacterium haemolyticum]MDH0343577.1 hypothetical protein [Chromobacterium haemolyticum]
MHIACQFNVGKSLAMKVALSMGNKRKFMILAGIMLTSTIAFGGWKFWHSHHETVITRLALDDDNNHKIISEVMARAYGAKNYDEAEECWNINRNDQAYCMKPMALDLVQTNGEETFYLFASGFLTESSHADSEGLAGAFVFHKKNLELIASDKALSYDSIGGAMPETVKLLPISRTGLMGWLIQVGGELNGGYAFRQPYLFMPKQNKILDTAKDVIGAQGASQYTLDFIYQTDTKNTSSEFYPLQLTVQDHNKQKIASYHFQFDSKQWKYVCADKTCGEEGHLPSEDDPEITKNNEENSAETEAAPPPPNNANAALFDDSTELSTADLREVLKALNATYVIKDQDNWGFVTPECTAPFKLSASIPKGSENDHNNLWVEGGNSCTSGNTEHSIWLFIRGEDGHLRANLGLPAKKATVADTGNQGYNDIRLSGNGFCEAIWRWNGERYEHQKNIATQPGGCDSK